MRSASPKAPLNFQPQSLPRLTTLCLFCRAKLEQRVCQGRALSKTETEVRDSLSKIESHTLANEAKHRVDPRTPQEVCNSSIQRTRLFALKRFRTGSDSGRPCAFLEIRIYWRPVATARGTETLKI